MASGELASPPYSRRVLTPLVVRALHFGSVLDRFLIVNVVSVAALTGLVFVLTTRLAVCASSDPQRSNAAGVIAASLVVLNPFVWHVIWTYPALTDELSLALGLGWLLVLTGTRTWVSWLSIPLAVLTVLCREAWGPPMLLALFACWLLLPARRALEATNAAVVLAAGVATLHMPMVPGPLTDSFATVARRQLDAHFTTTEGLARFLWMGAAGLGFVVLLGVVMRKAPGTRSLAGVVLALAAGHIVMAVLGGTDTDRILVPAAALLTALALGAVARVRAADPALAVAVLASLAVWQPWHRVSSDPNLWLKTFGVHAIAWEDMRAKLSGDALLLCIVVLIAAGLIVRASSVNAPSTRR